MTLRGTFRWDFALVLTAAALSSACTSSFQVGGRVGAGGRAGDGHAAAGAAAACVGPGSTLRVSTLGWDSESRRHFEADAKRGVIVVRAEQCNWTVLPRCSARQSYAYRSTPLSRERWEVGDTRGVGLGTAGSASVNRASGGLRDVAIIGSFDVSALPSASSLEGECDGATHVVAGYSAGAFQIDDSQSGGARVGVPYAHAQQTEWENLSNSDGRLEACATVAPNEPAPPVDCSAVLDIRIVPLAPPVSRTESVTVAASPHAPQRNAACADGNLTACDEGCRRGDQESCTALARACVAGAPGACISVSSMSLNQWLAGK